MEMLTKLEKSLEELWGFDVQVCLQMELVQLALETQVVELGQWLLEKHSAVVTSGCWSAELDMVAV